MRNMNAQMNQTTFGVEIEMTNITRADAANVIKNIVNGYVRRLHDSYDSYIVCAEDGRKWQCMYDGSIYTLRNENHADSNSEYSVEVVTPVLNYNEDIETLQQIVRELRKAGAKVNDSCGIHIHIGGDRHNKTTIKNFINYVSAREELFFDALEVIETRKNRYCKPMEKEFIDKVNATRRYEMSDLEDMWYNTFAPYADRDRHYNSSRYHFLNLHSYFKMSHHTIEIRGFNSTLHAGKIRAYVALCIAMNNFCLNASRVSAKPVQMDNPKFSMRVEMKRLGLIGDEFKEVREHLMKDLVGTTQRYNYVA